MSWEATNDVGADSSHRRDLFELIWLFYADAGQLGRFTIAHSGQMPDGFTRLLDHQHHMTVTVESYFGQRVRVVVLEAHRHGTRYWRKIVLRGEQDNRALQFGIVRLDLSVLAPEIQVEIEGQGKPLGRVLIEHQVLREVELLDLWRVELGDDLKQYLETERTTTYGRTALIHCDGEPAVELLEIVTPELEVSRHAG